MLQLQEMSEKMCPDTTKTNAQSISALIGFTYPKIHVGKTCYIDFYAYDPARSCMRRKKYIIPDAPTKKEFKQRSAEMVATLTQRLRGGWNPFVDSQSARGYTLIDDILDHYRAYLEKLPKATTRENYSSRLNILKEFNSTLAFPIKFAYQFDCGFVASFMDWLYLDRGVGERTYNNYRVWISSLATFMIERKYISENPARTVRKLRQPKKKRRDLTPEQLSKLESYLYENDKYLLLACMFEYYTFIRPNELSQLRVGHIIIKDRSVYVPAENSKNGRDGKVALNDVLIKLLLELEILNLPTDTYIFSKGLRPGTQKMDSDIFNKHWSRMRKILGWPDNLQFYSLKDSGIRDLANQEGIVVARDQARHTDITTTNKYLVSSIGEAPSAARNFNGGLGKNLL